MELDIQYYLVQKDMMKFLTGLNILQVRKMAGKLIGFFTSRKNNVFS